MLKSLTFVSLVATVALAQTLIPSGISDGCAAFLGVLDKDADLNKCTSALSSALSAFAPGANGSVSASTVTTALTTICGTSISTACPATLLAQKITNFYGNCSAELTTNPNSDVVRIYDILYSVPPLQEAICSKDDSGNWCVTSAAPASGVTADTIKSALFTQSGTDVIPNTSTYSTYNLAFLFINPDSANLCQTCTRNVLNSFIKQESNIPYAPGIDKSPLLSTQSALYSAVQSKCNASFMEGEVKAAGGLSSSNILGGSSGAVPSTQFQGFVAAFAGFATLAVATLL